MGEQSEDFGAGGGGAGEGSSRLIKQWGKVGAFGYERRLGSVLNSGAMRSRSTCLRCRRDILPAACLFFSRL